MQINTAVGAGHERFVDVNDIQIPDLWQIAMRILDQDDRKAVLDTWHLAHDMLTALQDTD